MKMPLRIATRHMPASEKLLETARIHAQRLDRARPLTRCEVVIEKPEGRAGAGGPVHVRVELSVPGIEVSVAHEDQDAYLAIGHAFAAARRTLFRRTGKRIAQRRAG